MDSVFSSCDMLESTSQHGSSEPRNLPLEYLRNITNNFSDDRLLGEGGFGMVYKGVLPNGETVAVKKLNSSMLPGIKDKQFENEACHLTRLKHPNILLLLGWCAETENTYVEYNGKHICAEKHERLLCLEYMPKGNLRQYLLDESSRLTWETRYKIIKGICYGLHYLHEERQLNAPIVHMDLKPANILLDNNMVPKIADFGLARLFSEEKTWTCTTNRDGTLGYMAPEYINRGLISTKSDIFSLGVIIIEIVTGQRDYPDESETGKSSQEFTDNVRKLISASKVLKNWRHRLQKSLEIDSQQIRRCIQIGLDCVKLDRSKRPTISQVIKMLKETESAVQSHPALIDDNQILSPRSHGFRVAPEVMPMELLEQSTNNFSEEQQLGSGTSTTVYMEPKFEEDRTVIPVMDASLRDIDFEYLQIIKNEDLEELRELGSGTFGAVYHGKWRGSDVAIKRIKKSCFTGRSSEQERLAHKFWREAEILSRLHHPNVVAFYGVVMDGPGGTLATVTEFMVNGSLRHVLQRKDKYLDHRKRLIIAMDAAFGMEYLHSKNIVHFDLKCDNLLVNLKDQTRPICKVGDFRISKIKRITLDSGGVRGIVPWMAPEILIGASNKVSEKVDVFSFGIVMWEILTGEEPYANMHYAAIIGGIAKNTLRPPVPGSCDPEWRRLMEQCWAPDPAQRPAFTEIAGHLRAMAAAAAAAGKGASPSFDS